MRANVAMCQSLYAENGSDYSNNLGYAGLASMQGEIAKPSWRSLIQIWAGAIVSSLVVWKNYRERTYTYETP